MVNSFTWYSIFAYIWVFQSTLLYCISQRPCGILSGVICQAGTSCSRSLNNFQNILWKLTKITNIIEIWQYLIICVLHFYKGTCSTSGKRIIPSIIKASKKPEIGCSLPIYRGPYIFIQISTNIWSIYKW